MTKFLDGIKLGFGFIFVIGILLGLVYAVGFHTANEITSGSFIGTFDFSGATVTGLTGGSGVLIDSSILCNSTNEGILRYNTTSKVLDLCNGDNWFEIKNAGLKVSCKDILDSGFSEGSGTYTIDPDGSGPLTQIDVYCDMTTDGGGWTYVVGIQSGSNAHVNSAGVSEENLASSGGIGKFNDEIINTIQNSGNNQLKLICNGVSQMYTSCDFDADAVTGDRQACAGTSGSGTPSYRVGLGSNNGQYTYNNAFNSVGTGVADGATGSMGCSTPDGNVVTPGYSGTVWVR